MGRARAPWTRSFINGAKVLLAQLDPRNFSLMRALATAFVLLGLVAGLLTLETTALGADDATETVRLEPGDNFVGWVADPIAIAEIFNQIPEAALIYRWDAESRTYRYAIRDGSATLETLQPGMAASIRIDGRKSVKWERPLTPAKGMVTLYSGENWVAWNGRDEWPLDQVARGIGSSLVSLEVEERGIVYQPGSDISEAIAPLNGESTLRRGDALRVTVNRDLRWLQPTGMMPNIVWAGDPSQSLKDESTADIRRIVEFFAGEFAVETDFSETTILLYTDFDAAVDYAESGAEPEFGYSPDWLRGHLTAGRTAQGRPWGFFMSACGWLTPSPQPCHDGTEAMVHEWFHLFQSQYRAGDMHSSPIWMIEGTATWAEWQSLSKLHNDSSAAAGQRQWRLGQVIRTTEPLESAEDDYYGWEYDLGSLAADRLAERSGADSLLEFFRQLHPQVIGMERSWELAPTWQEAFEATFELTASDFYNEFALWRESLPKPTQRKNYDSSDVTLTGTLHYSDGSPATGFIVIAEPYEDEIAVGIERAKIVDEKGAFTLYLASETTQRIRLNHAGCQMWVSNDGPTFTEPQPGDYLELDTRDLPHLDLTLPEGACSQEHQLQVAVLALRGDNRPITMWLNSEDGQQWIEGTRVNSGAYQAFALEAGKYHLRVIVGGCSMWYHEDGLVATRSAGQLLALSRKPVSIEVRVPHDLCVRTIHGRLVNEAGSPVGTFTLTANGPDAYGHAVWKGDGRFTVTVPESGEFRLTVWDGCAVYLGAAGATSDWGNATPITVADEDVTDIEFIVPADPSSLCR